MIKRGYLLVPLIISLTCIIIHSILYQESWNVGKDGGKDGAQVMLEVSESDLDKRQTVSNPHLCGRLCRVRKLILRTRRSFDSKAKAVLQSLYVSCTLNRAVFVSVFLCDLPNSCSQPAAAGIKARSSADYRTALSHVHALLVPRSCPPQHFKCRKSFSQSSCRSLAPSRRCSP